MHKTLIIILSLLSQLAFAQLVTINKVVKTHENNDRYLYKINPESTNAEFLGEIEVQGFSKDDAEVFSQIYKKAKTFGANSFALKKTENIDGSVAAFNPANYILNLYYTPEVPKDDNAVYIITSSAKPQVVVLNNTKIRMQPRTYLKTELKPGETGSVSTGKFLGSKIMLAAKDGQPAQYFQILPAGLRADQSGAGGLNLKSGDIILLEKSYGQFLTAIYAEH